MKVDSIDMQNITYNIKILNKYNFTCILMKNKKIYMIYKNNENNKLYIKANKLKCHTALQIVKIYNEMFHKDDIIEEAYFKLLFHDLMINKITTIKLETDKVIKQYYLKYWELEDKLFKRELLLNLGSIDRVIDYFYIKYLNECKDKGVSKLDN